MRLSVGHQHSLFWPILVRFVYYYSLFWVPERFPRLTIPGVRLRVRRQHSKFLAYSDPFRGLLLAVFVYQSDFHSC